MTPQDFELSIIASWIANKIGKNENKKDFTEIIVEQSDLEKVTRENYQEISNELKKRGL